MIDKQITAEYAALGCPGADIACASIASAVALSEQGDCQLIEPEQQVSSALSLHSSEGSQR